MEKYQITCDAHSYVVTYTNPRGKSGEIGYGDKETSMKDHAQNIYEVLAAMGATVEWVET